MYFGSIKHKIKKERLLETSSAVWRLQVSSMRLVALLSREDISPCG